MPETRRTNPGFLSNNEAARDRARTKAVVRGMLTRKECEKENQRRNFRPEPVIQAPTQRLREVASGFKTGQDSIASIMVDLKNRPSIEATNEKKDAPCVNINMELVDDLIGILKREKEKSVIKQKEKEKCYEGTVLSISENVATIRCLQADPFDIGDEVACVEGKNWTTGQVSDVSQKLLWVSLKDKNELLEGSNVEIVEVESVISYDVQLILLQDIKSGKTPSNVAPVDFFPVEEGSQ